MSDTHDDIGGVALLHVVLVDFVYLAVAHGYLSHTEGRALHAWVARKLFLHEKEHVVVWRVTGRFLETIDADDTQDLANIIARDATLLWAEELDIAGVAAGKRVPGAKDRNGPKDTGELAPGDTTLAVPFPARGMCWAHTNGKTCYELDSQGMQMRLPLLPWQVLWTQARVRRRVQEGPSRRRLHRAMRRRGWRQMPPPRAHQAYASTTCIR